MNKYDRRNLEDVADNLAEPLGEVQRIAEEQRERYDNMPEGLQMAETGTNLEEAADELDDIATELESIVERVRELT